MSLHTNALRNGKQNTADAELRAPGHHQLVLGFPHHTRGWERDALGDPVAPEVNLK